MNDREAWVRFAAGAASEPDIDAKACAKFADAMLVELNKRDLDDSPQGVALVSDEDGGTPVVVVQFSPEHTTEADELKIAGAVDVSQ